MVSVWDNIWTAFLAISYMVIGSFGTRFSLAPNIIDFVMKQLLSVNLQQWRQKHQGFVGGTLCTWIQSQFGRWSNTQAVVSSLVFALHIAYRILTRRSRWLEVLRQSESTFCDPMSPEAFVAAPEMGDGVYAHTTFGVTTFVTLENRQMTYTYDKTGKVAKGVSYTFGLQPFKGHKTPEKSVVAAESFAPNAVILHDTCDKTPKSTFTIWVRRDSPDPRRHKEWPESHYKFAVLDKFKSDGPGGHCIFAQYHTISQLRDREDLDDIYITVGYNTHKRVPISIIYRGPSIMPENKDMTWLIKPDEKVLAQLRVPGCKLPEPKAFLNDVVCTSFNWQWSLAEGLQAINFEPEFTPGVEARWRTVNNENPSQEGISVGKTDTDTYTTRMFGYCWHDMNIGGGGSSKLGFSDTGRAVVMHAGGLPPLEKREFHNIGTPGRVLKQLKNKHEGKQWRPQYSQAFSQGLTNIEARTKNLLDAEEFTNQEIDFPEDLTNVMTTLDIQPTSETFIAASVFHKAFKVHKKQMKKHGKHLTSDQVASLVYAGFQNVAGEFDPDLFDAALAAMEGDDYPSDDGGFLETEGEELGFGAGQQSAAIDQMHQLTYGDESGMDRVSWYDSSFGADAFKDTPALTQDEKKVEMASLKCTKPTISPVAHAFAGKYKGPPHVINPTVYEPAPEAHSAFGTEKAKLDFAILHKLMLQQQCDEVQNVDHASTESYLNPPTGYYNPELMKVRVASLMPYDSSEYIEHVSQATPAQPVSELRKQNFEKVWAEFLMNDPDNLPVSDLYEKISVLKGTLNGTMKDSDVVQSVLGQSHRIQKKTSGSKHKHSKHMKYLGQAPYFSKSVKSAPAKEPEKNKWFDQWKEQFTVWEDASEKYPEGRSAGVMSARGPQAEHDSLTHQFDTKAAHPRKEEIDEEMLRAFTAGQPAPVFNHRETCKEFFTRVFRSMDPSTGAAWSKADGASNKGDWISDRRNLVATYMRVALLICYDHDTIKKWSPLDLFEAGILIPEEVFTKPEVHKRKKSDAGRWRVIWFASAAADALIRAFHHDQNKVEVALYQDGQTHSKPFPTFGSCSGMGHHDEGLSDMCTAMDNMLVANGERAREHNGVSQDAKSWDILVTRALWMTDAWRRHALALEGGAPEGFAYALLNLGLVLSAHLIVVDGEVFEVAFFGIMASGIPSTSASNSFMRCFLHSYAFQILLGVFGLSLSMGDDNHGRDPVTDEHKKVWADLGHIIEDSGKLIPLGEPVSFTSHAYNIDECTATFDNGDKLLLRLALESSLPLTKDQATGIRFAVRHTPVLKDFVDDFVREHNSSWLSVDVTSGDIRFDPKTVF